MKKYKEDGYMSERKDESIKINEWMGVKVVESMGQ